MTDELIEVEFIRDAAKRRAGDRLRVDAASAASMVGRGDARETGVRTPAPDTRMPGDPWTTVDLVHIGGAKVGEVTWRTDTPLIRVGGDLIPERVEVIMPGVGGQPVLSMRVEVRQGVPAFTRVEFASGQDDRAVSSQDLDIVRKMMPGWLDDILTLAAQGQPERARPGGRKRREITREFLAGVAELYRANVGRHPVKAIEQNYGTHYRTAARWVDLCRSDEYQLLPKTTPGKKKA